jgi:ribosomal protein L16 Arg81 hydroxylase
MDLQHIVHHHTDQIMNEIKNILDVHQVEIDTDEMENHQKSMKNKMLTYLDLTYFFRHSKKSSKSHRVSRSRSPTRERSSTVDKDRKSSQTSTSQITPTTVSTNEPLDKV